MISLDGSLWMLSYYSTVSGKHPFFIFGGNFTTLIRVGIYTGYNYIEPKYGGKFLALKPNSSTIISIRRINLNQEYLWYFPVEFFSLKYIPPNKYLPGSRLTIKQYKIPIAQIPTEDLLALGQP